MNYNVQTYAAGRRNGKAHRQKLVLVRLPLLFMLGISLRLTLLAVPPLLPAIRAELKLSATAVALLVTLPIALFAVAALPAWQLIARIGPLRTLILGLFFVTIGAALRGQSGAVGILFLTTMIMGVGVALMQPAMPAIVRRWLPERIAFGTAIYTTGLFVGQTVPPSLTIPFVLPWLGGSWRGGLAIWSVPVGLTALFCLVLAPWLSDSRTPNEPSNGVFSLRWNDSLIWRLGVLFGTINTMYFTTNALLPIYLKSVNRPDLITGALTALSFGQLPAALLLLIVAHRLDRQSWPYVAAGVITLLSIAGLVFWVGKATFLFCGLLGFADGGAFLLGLTLPPLLSPASEVPRTSAAMFTISYSSAVLIAAISGAIWDAGAPRWAFAPVAFCALTLAVIGVLLRATGQLH